MALHPLQRWQHGHDFHLQTRAGERRTLLVVWLTGITMLVEVGAGCVSASMALLADGFHRGSLSEFMRIPFSSTLSMSSSNRTTTG